MAHGQRYFLYCQHLAGTGHFVRTHEIALALSEQHEVYLVDGGRPVPRFNYADRLTLISIPRIFRNEQGILPVDADQQIHKIMRQRSLALLQAIERIRPDVVMIEHFPFSKWELHNEIIFLIRRARAVNKRVPVVCSSRDIAPGSRDNLGNDRSRRAALQVLDAQFDLVLVHADPYLVRLEEHVPWAAEIKPPVEYTGYVSQRPSDGLPGWNETIGQGKNQRKMVIVSAGGDGRTGLAACSIAAWELLHSKGIVADYTLAVFLPLFPRPEELAILEHPSNDDSIRVFPFQSDFIDWMQHGCLSISQAGYNTCTNILQTNIRSILVPNMHMTDQCRRAKRFAERGLAFTIEPTELTPQRLARAILDQLSAPAPRHGINLDGARITRQILERLCAGHTPTREIAEREPPIQAA